MAAAPLIVFVGAMIAITGLLDLIDPKSINYEQRFLITLALSAIAALVMDALGDSEGR